MLALGGNEGLRVGMEEGGWAKEVKEGGKWEKGSDVQTPIVKAQRPSPVKMFLTRYCLRARIKASV